MPGTDGQQVSPARGVKCPKDKGGSPLTPSAQPYTPSPFCFAKGGRVERSETQGVHTPSKPQTPKTNHPSILKILQIPVQTTLDNRNISANIATKRRSAHPRTSAPKTKNRRVEKGCAQTFQDAARTIE